MGRSRSCRPSQVRRGDRLLVRAGDTIPVDGEVDSGRSSVDQKTITGESVPVVREPGDPVYAGTVNGEGTLEVRASGPVGDALISRVVAQVRASQAGRAPIERRISRFAAIYTPIVVGLSLLVMLGPPLWPRSGRARRLGLGRCARMVQPGAGGAGDRVPVCAGDRDAGGRRERTGGGGAGGHLDPWGRVPRGDRPAARPGLRQDGDADPGPARRRRGRLRPRSRRRGPRAADRRGAGRPRRSRAGQGDRPPRPGPEPRRAGRRRLHGGPRPGALGASRRGRISPGQPSLHRRGRAVPARVPRPARSGGEARSGRRWP